MRIQGPDGRWYVGGYSTEAEAVDVDAALDNGPGVVMRAAAVVFREMRAAGQDAGRYELIVNVAPDGKHRVECQLTRVFSGP